MSHDVHIVEMSDLNRLIWSYKAAAYDEPAGVVVPPGTIFASGGEAIDPGTIPKLCGLQVIVSELLPSNSIYILGRHDVDRFMQAAA